MIKSIVKSILLNKPVARLLIKPALKLHSSAYKWASRWGLVLNDNVHPKHRIIDYSGWFTKNISAGQVVMEIGSGAGYLTAALAEKAGFVYAIEISPRLLEEARAKNSAANIEYICADALTYDYQTARPVDCVVMSNVLEHIRDRVTLLKRIVSLVNWAEPGKKEILLRVPMFNRDWIVPYKRELNVEWRLDKSHEVEYTTELLREELSQANIEISRYEICFGEAYVVCRAI